MNTKCEASCAFSYQRYSVVCLMSNELSWLARLRLSQVMIAMRSYFPPSFGRAAPRCSLHLDMSRSGQYANGSYPFFASTLPGVLSPDAIAVEPVLISRSQGPALANGNNDVLRTFTLSAILMARTRCYGSLLDVRYCPIP